MLPVSSVARIDGVLVDRHLGHEVFDRVADDDDVPAVQRVDRLDARRLVEILRLAPAVGQFQSGQPERLIDEHAGVGLALRARSGGGALCNGPPAHRPKA